MLQKFLSATEKFCAEFVKGAEQSSCSLGRALVTQMWLQLGFCPGWDKMAAAFRPVQRPYKGGLGALQKLSEEKGVWPFVIRPKAWEDLVGAGKGLLGPKVWEVEYGESQG